MGLLYAVLILLPALTFALEELKPFNDTAMAFFLIADADMDGFIDKKENFNSFSEYDGDSDGVTTRQEYTDHVIEFSPTLLAVSLALFSLYDADDDGQLKKNDFDHFYSLMDGNGDGQLTQWEYVQYWIDLFELMEQKMND
ncbi:unnamed protein product [Lymnaea stagnalis]|uniref:EF-hand domain-containing protein n=1 Tax=Lymnaea stagnalis TaxID=6523 RepID=A0AAV2I9M5_LYMST